MAEVKILNAEVRFGVILVDDNGDLEEVQVPPIMVKGKDWSDFAPAALESVIAQVEDQLKIRTGAALAEEEPAGTPIPGP